MSELVKGEILFYVCLNDMNFLWALFWGLIGISLLKRFKYGKKSPFN